MLHCKFLYCLAGFLTNYSLVVDFVMYRYNTNPLDNVLLFQSENFSSDGIEHELQSRLQIPLLITKNEMSPNICDFVNHNSLALIFLAHLEEQIMLQRVLVSLRHRPHIPMLFVSQKAPDSSVVILKFFEDFWTRSFCNLVLIYRTNGAIVARAYDAFPKPHIVTLDATKFSKFFWPKHENLHGHSLLVRVFDDSPVAFALPNKTGLGGLMGEVFRVFMKRVNGTFSLHKMTTENIDRMDISANLLVPTREFLARLDFSYPLYQTHMCLMLPVEREVPLSWYLWYIFDALTWTLSGLAFLGLVLLVYFIGWRYDNERYRDIGLYIMIALKLVLTHPISSARIFSVKRSMYLALLCGLFMILVNIYISSLTSLLSARARMPKILTSEDILKTDLKIMVTPRERELYFETNLLPKSLTSRLYYEANYTLIEKNRLKANGSYAYIVSMQKWLWYKRQQAYLKQPYLRIASDELCTPPIQQIFYVKKNSPFRETLMLLGRELQQFGFIDQWLEGIKPNEKLTISNETWRDEDKKPLELEHYLVAFWILVTGWSLALFVFMAELIIWRRQETFRTRVILRLRK